MSLLLTPPTFEEWGHYCLTQGYADFNCVSDDDDWDARRTRFLTLPKPLLTDYLIRLFENPAFIADRYTDDQIGDAIWYIFGCASGYCHDARDPDVLPETQIRWMRSLVPLYTQLFDRVCGRRGSDPDTELSNTHRVDVAVYMIWDMGGVEGAIMFPEKGPHLVEPGFKVLRTILRDCHTSACLQSAIHALNHIGLYHESRCVEVIDDFLAARGRTIPSWLSSYAALARVRGCQ